jgi:hypothetical protein
MGCELIGDAQRPVGVCEEYGSPPYYLTGTAQ